MKKILITALLLAGITATAQVKVGTNPTTIDTGTTNFQVEGTTTAEQFVVLKNGNVGIGTTTPIWNLEVDGSMGIYSPSDAGFELRAQGIVSYIDFSPDAISKTSPDYLYRVAASSTRFDIIGPNSGYFTLHSNGNTGIGGLTNGVGRLNVRGINTDGSTEIIRLTNGSNTEVATFLDNGNLGIGIDNPTTAKIHVNPGNPTDDVVVAFKSSRAGITDHINYGNYFNTGSFRTGGIIQSDGAFNISVSSTGSNHDFNIFRATANTDIDTAIPSFMVEGSNGNVGIGTATPAGMLNISGGSASVIIDRFVEGIEPANLHTRKARGTQSAPTAVLNGDQLGSVAFQGYDGTAYRAVAQVRADAAEDYSPSGYGSNLVFLNNPASGGGLTERMRLLSNGNFGIGTSTPAGKLTVGTGGNLLLNRSDNATGTSIYNGGALVGTIIDDLNSEPISLRIGGNTRVYVATTGNVGIGTTAPTSRLHVVGLPVYADNATAKAAMGGAAAVGAFFHTGDGIVRVVF